MSIYADRAEALFEQGFNCAQAVFGAFADAFGLDQDTAMLVASSLGGGLAHTGQTCGAVLGMALAVGMAKGYITPDGTLKQEHNARVKRLVEDFAQRFGSVTCDDLREVGNRTVCVPYVRFAAEQVVAEIGE